MKKENKRKTRLMLNIEKYYDEIKQRLETTDVDNLFCTVNEFRTGCDDCTMLSNCRNCCLKNLEWLNQDYKEKILNDVEREYLSAVIKPFRKIIVTVSKHRLNNDLEYIAIRVKSLKEDEEENMCFPAFKIGTIYKGMVQGKHYTLEELGL